MAAENLSSHSISRRRVPRRHFDCPVGLLVRGSYRPERAFQVGEGGMMISSQGEPLREGQMVVVSFFIPPGSLIMVRGTVRSIVPEGKGLPVRYGIEFVNLGFQLKRVIRNFVAAATQLDGQLV